MGLVDKVVPEHGWVRGRRVYCLADPLAEIGVGWHVLPIESVDASIGDEAGEPRVADLVHIVGAAEAGNVHPTSFMRRNCSGSDGVLPQAMIGKARASTGVGL